MIQCIKAIGTNTNKECEAMIIVIKGGIEEIRQKNNVPKPPTDDILSDYYYCTCLEFNWPIHPCPYDADINDDGDDKCNCCPFRSGG